MKGIKVNTNLDYIYLRGILIDLYENGIISFDEWYKALLELRIAYSLIIVS